MLQHLLAPALKPDRALLEDARPVRMAERGAHVLLDHKDGNPCPFDAVDDVVHLVDHPRRQPQGWLIEEHDFGEWKLGATHRESKRRVEQRSADERGTPTDRLDTTTADGVGEAAANQEQG